MINYDAGHSPEYHLETVVLNKHSSMAPGTLISQLEDEWIATSQKNRANELTDKLQNNLATTDSTSTTSLLKNLQQQQIDLTKRRDKILSLPLLYLRFQKKSELKDIESKLDLVEIEFYKIQGSYKGLINELNTLNSEVKRKTTSLISNSTEN